MFLRAACASFAEGRRDPRFSLGKRTRITQRFAETTKGPKRNVLKWLGYVHSQAKTHTPRVLLSIAQTRNGHKTAKMVAQEMWHAGVYVCGLGGPPEHSRAALPQLPPGLSSPIMLVHREDTEATPAQVVRVSGKSVCVCTFACVVEGRWTAVRRNQEPQTYGRSAK